MLNMRSSVAISKDQFLDALEFIGAHKESGHSYFAEKVRVECSKFDDEPNVFLSGLSYPSIKRMRANSESIQNEKLCGLIKALYEITGIDASEDKLFEGVSNLDFEPSLRVTATVIDEEKGILRFENFRFSIQEASDKAVSRNGDDVELDVRVGFDRVRMVLEPKSLELEHNWVCGMDEQPSDEEARDYTGDFKMRYVDDYPINWVFLPYEEGKIVKGAVNADLICHAKSESFEEVSSTITAARNSVRVRVVGDNEDGKFSSRSMSEMYRDRVCAELVKRVVMERIAEFQIIKKNIEVDIEQ